MKSRRGVGAGAALALCLAGSAPGGTEMEPREGFVTTEDGVRLHFAQVGDGGRVVLIPNGIYLIEDFKPLASDRTLIFYDVRNRGRSDSGEAARLARGIAQDVDDLDAVRRHFGIDRVDLIGHSYVGVTVLLYAMKQPAHVGRLVAIGALPPDSSKAYTADLTGQDETSRAVMAALGELQKERALAEPTEFCRRVWAVLRRLYVVDPKDADRIRWDRCELAKERSFLKYWTENLMPSVLALALTAEELARVEAPVLLVHGRRDRSSPYGGARDWALGLPNARLLTVQNGAHAPWIEAPETLASIQTFMNGAWPKAAVRAEALD